LTKLSDLSQVGIYSLAYKFGLLGQMLLSGPLMMTWQPKSFEIAHEEGSPKIFAQMFTYFVFIQVYFTLALSILVKPMLILMAEPSYHSAHQYVPLISVSYIFQAIFLYIQFGLLNEKKTAVVGISALTAAGVNLLLNFILIQRFTIWGAVLATVISYGLLPLIIFRPSQRCYHIPFESVKLVKITLSAIFCYLITLPLEFGSFWLTVAAKTVVILLFPCLLFLWRVTSVEEIQRLKNVLLRR
jgi:O-antigen/teichoic acid export membrane protein